MIEELDTQFPFGEAEHSLRPRVRISGLSSSPRHTHSGCPGKLTAYGQRFLEAANLESSKSASRIGLKNWTVSFSATRAAQTGDDSPARDVVAGLGAGELADQRSIVAIEIHGADRIRRSGGS